MKNSHLIEYGKECELLERVDGKYKVRIYGKDEIVEKLVDYTPIINDEKRIFCNRHIRVKNRN